MKKIVSAILLISMLLVCLVSCGDGAPKGYQLVSDDNEMFKLYAPKNWVDNSDSGVASAYYSLESDIVVSATTTRNAINYTLGEFMTLAKESYEEMSGYEKVTEPQSISVAGLPAYSMEYKATVDMKGEDKKVETVVYKFKSVLIKYEATFTIITYSAPLESYDKAIGDLDGILSNFVFRDDVEVEKDDFTVLVDENTPDGYQIATNPKYEFRFYVPLSWKVQRRAYNPSAYVDKELTNISVSAKVLSSDYKDAADYWSVYTETTSFELSNIVTDENAKLGKYDAYSVEYTASLSGIDYRMKQVFMVTNNMIYIVTYTSDNLHYDKHIGEVNEMLKLFEFKK